MLKITPLAHAASGVEFFIYTIPVTQAPTIVHVTTDETYAVIAAVLAS
jgi:hypothetical protein